MINGKLDLINAVFFLVLTGKYWETVITICSHYCTGKHMVSFALSHRLLWQRLLVFLVLVLGSIAALHAQPQCCSASALQLYTTTVSQTADSCCVRIYGRLTLGTASPCNSSNGIPYAVAYDIQEYSFGSWVRTVPSTPITITAPQHINTVLCKPNGHHVFKLRLFDMNGNVLCERTISYTCGTVNCCDNVQMTGNNWQNNNPDSCCFTINGWVNDNCAAVATWHIEELASGQWTQVAVGSIPNAWQRSFGASFCRWRAQGPFHFRVVLRDILGNVICMKETQYDCNDNACCQLFDFQLLPMPSDDPKQCCFALQGTESPLCSFGTEYVVEELTSNGWQNISGAYQPISALSNKTFRMELCRLVDGVYKFRIILRSGGTIYCVKEVQYTCGDSCCETIQILTGDVTHMDNCCQTSFALSLGDCASKIESYEVEKFVFGQWGEALGNPIPPGLSTITHSDCIPFGTTKVRFTFYTTDGSVLCVKEVDFDCSSSCCEQLNVVPSGQLDVQGQCCIRFNIDIPWCFPEGGGLIIQEMKRHGTWGDGDIAMVMNPGTSMEVVHCFSASAAIAPNRVRLVFYNSDGSVLCMREFAFECLYTVNPGGDPGVLGPGKFGSNANEVPVPSAGVVQQLSSMPNPATDETVVSYQLVDDAPVSIQLVDALGRHTVLQSTAVQNKGVHALPVSTTHLAAGRYTVVVKAGNHTATLGIVVLK